MGSSTRVKNQRGFVLITMAVTAVLIMGAVGLSVDIGHMLIAKTELQNFVDSAAIAAALKLNGALTGFTYANTAVSSSANGWNFATSRVTNTRVDFATTSVGPWSSNPATGTGYQYVRVWASVQVPLFFMPMVVSQNTSTVSAQSIAGQIPVTTYTVGLGPFTAVASDLTSPTFGFTVGNEYDIQWPQYNGTRAGCSTSNPEKCFVQSPCSGEAKAAEQAVVQYWGASINGFWGSNANSTINAEVLNNVQMQPVSIGQAIMMTSGNKAAEAVALDTRVNQDWDVLDNDPSAYLANGNHNGRRFLDIPIVNPTASGTYVVGFASFLLKGDGSNPSNYYRSQSGNDPFCAVYAGSYVQGATDPGASSGAASFRVRLLQ